MSFDGNGRGSNRYDLIAGMCGAGRGSSLGGVGSGRSFPWRNRCQSRSARLLFVVLILLLQLINFVLHLFHVLLHGLDSCSEIIQFVGRGRLMEPDDEKQNETSGERDAVVLHVKR